MRIPLVALALSIALGSVSGAGDGIASKRMPDGKEWTTDNLAVHTADSCCYDNNELNCRRYGRLYTWDAARQGCQSLGPRWRLPTNDEWHGLAKHYGGLREESADQGKAAFTALIAGGSSGFNAQLGGNREIDGVNFGRLDAHGLYWTSSETDAANAWMYNFGRGQQSLGRHQQGDKRRALSVRCIKE